MHCNDCDLALAVDEGRETSDDVLLCDDCYESLAASWAAETYDDEPSVLWPDGDYRETREVL